MLIPLPVALYLEGKTLLYYKWAFFVVCEFQNQELLRDFVQSETAKHLILDNCFFVMHLTFQIERNEGCSKNIVVKDLKEVCANKNHTD